MPSATSVIDVITTPPLASLQQVLDTNGPYHAGDHEIVSFHTNGAFLLPAGDHDVSGTYGVLVIATTIPAAAGHTIGFNGLISGQDRSCDLWHDRIAQVCLFHQFPISGAWLNTDIFDVHYASQLILWSVFVGSGGRIGLHIFPNWAVDLYFMCVL